MTDKWASVVIQRVSSAVFVSQGTGRANHSDRPYHGLVLNDKDACKDYYFSDGRVMHTHGNELFYLPKGSTYFVKSVARGDCFAINFLADIDDEPFCINLKNNEQLKKSFKTACDEWRMNDDSRQSAAMRALYDAIYLLQKEQSQTYMPNKRHSLILPAIELIERDFTSPSLTVLSLATLCGMSEVYFRKTFLHKFGVSPKEYIIQKRMKYALELLNLGEFEVSQVAILCGYTEPCHFSREFKKRFGKAPKNYIQQEALSNRK